MKVIISGGGTGGHVFPAIAIADAIRKIEPGASVLFVGAVGKLEMEKVPKAGYPIEGLWVSGFQRKLTLQNLLFPVKLAASWWKARQIVQSFKPDVAVGVGGYASGPTLNVATSLGIPALIQEQNSYPGITNRLLAKKAARICVAYEGLERYFPADKIVLTGNPVRSDFFENLESKKEEALAHFGLYAAKKTLLIVGGSLGARTLNEAMEAAGNMLSENVNIQVIWQMGRLYIDSFGKCSTAALPNVKAVPFIDRMDLAYAAADVIIARAGALTISELCLIGKPVILVPSPNVAEDHQTKNAQSLVKKDAALLVADSAAISEMMWAALDLLRNDTMAHKLAANIRQLARPDAAKDIAHEVIRLAG
jgi:UDP-N-acetylglucosamine--N-acetylmuramyl-(pentapeptide) pyrophosphoryl-undecaprenol N-acetylglucosamine transferase